MNKTSQHFGSDEIYDEKEAAARRDAVVRRMANTPPKPKATAPHPSKKKRKAGAGRTKSKKV